MLHGSTQRSDAKWSAHLLACRQNLYIARLGQLHPHPAQRVANDDHVRSLAESMEESAVLKFQHPLEVVLDNDDVLLDLPPLSHLPATATASILCGQHRHLACTLFLRKQIFAASSAGEYTSPLDVPDCVALNHPDATWPCVVYSHGGILHYDGGPSPHSDILSYPPRTFARRVRVGSSYLHSRRQPKASFSGGDHNRYMARKQSEAADDCYSRSLCQQA